MAPIAFASSEKASMEPDVSRMLDINCRSQGTVVTDDTPTASLGCVSDERTNRIETIAKPKRGVRIALVGHVDNADQFLKKWNKTMNDDFFSALYSAYKQRGATAFSELRGSYSIILHDNKNDETICIRDKTGTRHLYLSRIDDGVVVGSSVESLLTLSSVDPTPDPTTLAHFLCGRLQNTTSTFFSGIRRLLPGTYARIVDGGISIDRYWDPTDSQRGDSELTPPPARMFRCIFDRAVEQCLDRMERPAVLLSGGLDSTAITATVDRTSDEPPLCLSALPRNADGSLDERTGIDAMLRNTNSTLETFQWTGAPAQESAIGEVLPDHPCVDMSVPLYQKAATKLSRRGVVGAFTGLGGNLFDGNRFYYADLCRAGAVRRLVRELVDDEMNALGAFVMFVLQPLTSEPHRLAEEQRTMDFAGVDSIVEWSDVPHRRTLPSVSVEPPSFETAERLVLWQSFTDAYTDFALDSINRIADKRGIEFHHPLLDSRLISMVFDAQLGTLRSHGTAKHLFKTAVDDRLPNSVLNQSTDANGYSPIVQRDLRTSARSSVENLLDDPHVATFGFIDATALSEFCRDFLSSDHNNHRPIWRFVVVNRWLKSISSGTTNLQ